MDYMTYTSRTKVMAEIQSQIYDNKNRHPLQLCNQYMRETLEACFKKSRTKEAFLKAIMAETGLTRQGFDNHPAAQYYFNLLK